MPAVITGVRFVRGPMCGASLAMARRSESVTLIVGQCRVIYRLVDGVYVHDRSEVIRGTGQRTCRCGVVQFSIQGETYRCAAGCSA